MSIAPPCGIDVYKRQVEKRARGICKQMEQKLSEYVPGEHLTVSIGIALSESEETSFETLYQNADVALYRAKCKGKNTCEIYKGPS